MKFKKNHKEMLRQVFGIYLVDTACNFIDTCLGNNHQGSIFTVSIW